MSSGNSEYNKLICNFISCVRKPGFYQDEIDDLINERSTDTIYQEISLRLQTIGALLKVESTKFEEILFNELKSLKNFLIDMKNRLKEELSYMNIEEIFENTPVAGK